MTTYYYKTDAVSGEIDAASLSDALELVRAEESITDAAIADGAWCWVESEDGDRLSCPE